MKRVFGDTSFFVASISPRDVHHDRALAFMREYEGDVLTTDFVIVELANYLYRIKDRPFFESVWEHVQQNPQFHVLEASRELLQRGAALFADRPDKKWSLTDCISFVVMEEHGITDALTSDGDFEQAGFTKLL